MRSRASTTTTTTSAVAPAMVSQTATCRKRRKPYCTPRSVLYMEYAKASSTVPIVCAGLNPSHSEPARATAGRHHHAAQGGAGGDVPADDRRALRVVERRRGPRRTGCRRRRTARPTAGWRAPTATARCWSGRAARASRSGRSACCRAAGPGPAPPWRRCSAPRVSAGWPPVAGRVGRPGRAAPAPVASGWTTCGGVAEAPAEGSPTGGVAASGPGSGPSRADGSCGILTAY